MKCTWSDTKKELFKNSSIKGRNLYIVKIKKENYL